MKNAGKGIVLLALSLSLNQTVNGEQMKILSFYDVRPINSELCIDGELTEPEWKTACSHNAYYEYVKPNPKPGALDTEFKMLYSKRGLYLAIINRENNMANLTAKVTGRDARNLWTDDCDEIYIDAFGDAVGYTKFSVNSIGTVADMKRIDQAVTLDDWSGIGWTCAVTRNSASWVVEAFFPWDDLGNTAFKGSVWRFCNTRYAYTSGKFTGVTSSPGGSYLNTVGFGYLYFSGEKPLSLNQIGEVLLKKASYGWMLPAGDKLAICEEKSGFRIEAVAEYIKKQKDEVLKVTAQTENIIQNLEDVDEKVRITTTLEKITSDLNKTDTEKANFSENISILQKLSQYNVTVNNAYWLAKTMKLLNKIYKKGSSKKQ